MMIPPLVLVSLSRALTTTRSCSGRILIAIDDLSIAYARPPPRPTKALLALSREDCQHLMIAKGSVKAHVEQARRGDVRSPISEQRHMVNGATSPYAS